MSNCGKWLNKQEFRWCVCCAMAKHKRLFGETPKGDQNRHWVYSLIDEMYKDYVDTMKEQSEDWLTYLRFGKKTYVLYVDCDDHQGKHSFLKPVGRTDKDKK